MVWLFKAGMSRQDLNAEQVKGRERTMDDGTIITSSCLAHFYRGGLSSGVLWSVWEAMKIVRVTVEGGVNPI